MFIKYFTYLKMLGQVCYFPNLSAQSWHDIGKNKFKLSVLHSQKLVWKSARSNFILLQLENFILMKSITWSSPQKVLICSNSLITESKLIIFTCNINSSKYCLLTNLIWYIFLCLGINLHENCWLLFTIPTK